MALLTIVIASSIIGVSGFVNSAFADTKKSTSQSYLSLPITVGVHNANRGGDDSSDDGPPPAVLRNEKSHSATSEDSDWTTADNNTIHSF